MKYLQTVQQTWTVPPAIRRCRVEWNSCKHKEHLEH